MSKKTRYVFVGSAPRCYGKTQMSMERMEELRKKGYKVIYIGRNGIKNG